MRTCANDVIHAGITLPLGITATTTATTTTTTTTTATTVKLGYIRRRAGIQVYRNCHVTARLLNHLALGVRWVTGNYYYYYYYYYYY